MKISRMLPLFEDLEGSLADLYRMYADRFKPVDREASDVFSSLSAEELVHKEIVQHVRLLIGANPASFKDADEDMDMAYKALTKVKQARMSNAPVTVEEAVRFALLMEVMSTEWYDITAVAETEPKYGKFLKIFLESQGHLKKLVDFAESRGWGYRIDRDEVRAQVSA